MRRYCGITCLALAGLIQAHAADWTPVTAVITQTDTKFAFDGSSTVTKSSGMFYRESSGRTRTEIGGTAVISDPTAGTVTTLDIRTKTAQVSIPPLAGASSTAVNAGLPDAAGVTRPKPTQKPVVPLGRLTVNGVAVEGFRGEAVAPVGAVGNILPLKLVSETWHSADLRLTVRTKTTDSLVQVNGDHVTRERVVEYTDLKTGVEPEAALFTIPVGFQTK